MKLTLELNPTQADQVVIDSLKTTYTECVKTILSRDRQLLEDMADAARRQAAVAELLAYYMVPKDYTEFISNFYKKLVDTEEE